MKKESTKPKSSKKGIPYKSENEKALIRIELRLNAKQAEKLYSKVEQSNLTTSEFIRQKIGIK